MTVREPKGVSWDADVQRWNAPFIMAAINTRVVARSGHLLKREPFLYQETHSFPVRSVRQFSHGVVGCVD